MQKMQTESLADLVRVAEQVQDFSPKD